MESIPQDTETQTQITRVRKPQAPIKSLCPWCHLPRDATFPHMWRTGQQHIICEDPHSEIPPPLSPSHHHHSTLVFLSDLGASRSQTAPEASPTRDSSAALCMGLWL